MAIIRSKKVKCPPNQRLPLQIKRIVNDVWSMDFVSNSLSNSKISKYFTVRPGGEGSIFLLIPITSQIQISLQSRYILNQESASRWQVI
jgi:hypothetical protein